MHDSCAFHAGLESPVKMISMRRIWAQRPNLVSNSRPDPIIGASRMGMLLVRLAIARSPSCVRQDPFSRPTNWQFFGNARSRKCLPLIRPMMRPPGRIGIFSSQRAIQFSVQSVMPAASRIPPPRSVYDERGLTCSTAHHDRIRPRRPDLYSPSKTPSRLSRRSRRPECRPRLGCPICRRRRVPSRSTVPDRPQ
jgi:hypothetical protein